MADETISREEAQDHFNAAIAQRDAYSNEALQLRIALAQANRKIEALEKDAQPQSNVINLPSADSEAA